MTVRARLASGAVLLLVLSALGPAVAAATLPAPYSARAIVTGTEEPERTRGFRLALTDVLIKLTGDVRLGSSLAVAAVLENPHRFVERFDYEDRMKGLPVRDEQGTRERPHDLLVTFRGHAVEAALRTLDLRRWANDRPLVAVWLAVRTANRRYVLSAAGPEGYGERAALTETAARRGVPILLPPEDQSSVGFEDVAGADLRRLRLAAPGSDALLVGTLSIAAGGSWNITWRLHWQERSRAWSLTAVSFDRAFRNGIETTALVLSGSETLPE